MKGKNTEEQYTLRLLVIRFSAIGDVAMTVPVVKALALSRPDVHVIVASRPYAKAFYEGLAPNVDFVGVDLKDKRYKGLFGLERLYKDLTAFCPDVVADLHDVLRTKYLAMRFMIAGIPVSVIDKCRKERKKLLKGEGEGLVSVFARYATVFENIGFVIPGLFDNKSPEPVIDIKHHVPQCSKNILEHVVTKGAIGIAPFAAHEGKIYPVEKMERVIKLLRERFPTYPLLFFGGGKRDEEVFNAWCQKFSNVFFASRECHDMRDEMYLMQYLQCMVSMDSANMHLASLVGVPVVSVWGATHTAAGFMGWKQSYDDIVERHMECRPCSIYGNKPCKRGDYACLNDIEPEEIVNKVAKHVIQ